MPKTPSQVTIKSALGSTDTIMIIDDVTKDLAKIPASSLKVTTLTSGNPPPSNTEGRIDDLYVCFDEMVIYKKALTGWGPKGPLKGADGTGSGTNIPVYGGGDTYQPTNMVQFNGRAYICKTANLTNVAPTPEMSTSDWTYIGTSASDTTYAALTEYAVGAICTHQGRELRAVRHISDKSVGFDMHDWEFVENRRQVIQGSRPCIHVAVGDKLTLSSAPNAAATEWVHLGTAVLSAPDALHQLECTQAGTISNLEGKSSAGDIVHYYPCSELNGTVCYDVVGTVNIAAGADCRGISETDAITPVDIQGSYEHTLSYIEGGYRYTWRESVLRTYTYPANKLVRTLESTEYHATEPFKFSRHGHATQNKPRDIFSRTYRDANNLDITLLFLCGAIIEVFEIPNDPATQDLQFHSRIEANWVADKTSGTDTGVCSYTEFDSAASWAASESGMQLSKAKVLWHNATSNDAKGGVWCVSYDSAQGCWNLANKIKILTNGSTPSSKQIPSGKSNSLYVSGADNDYLGYIRKVSESSVTLERYNWGAAKTPASVSHITYTSISMWGGSRTRFSSDHRIGTLYTNPDDSTRNLAIFTGEDIFVYNIANGIQAKTSGTPLHTLWTRGLAGTDANLSIDRAEPRLYMNSIATGPRYPGYVQISQDGKWLYATQDSHGSYIGYHYSLDTANVSRYDGTRLGLGVKPSLVLPGKLYIDSVAAMSAVGDYIYIARSTPILVDVKDPTSPKVVSFMMCETGMELYGSSGTDYGYSFSSSGAAFFDKYIFSEGSGPNGGFVTVLKINMTTEDVSPFMEHVATVHSPKSDDAIFVTCGDLLGMAYETKHFMQFYSTSDIVAKLDGQSAGHVKYGTTFWNDLTEVGTLGTWEVAGDPNEGKLTRPMYFAWDNDKQHLYISEYHSSNPTGINYSGAFITRWKITSGSFSANLVDPSTQTLTRGYSLNESITNFPAARLGYRDGKLYLGTNYQGVFVFDTTVEGVAAYTTVHKTYDVDSEAYFDIKQRRLAFASAMQRIATFSDYMVFGGSHGLQLINFDGPARSSEGRNHNICSGYTTTDIGGKDVLVPAHLTKSTDALDNPVEVRPSATSFENIDAANSDMRFSNIVHPNIRAMPKSSAGLDHVYFSENDLGFDHLTGRMKRAFFLKDDLIRWVEV